MHTKNSSILKTIRHFVLFCAPLLFLVSASFAQNGTILIQHERTDGKIENYYAAGDKYLKKGLEYANTFFSVYSSSTSARGGLDEYVPFCLKRWRNNAADALMKRYADNFYNDMYFTSTSTKLVPWYGFGNQDNDPTNKFPNPVYPVTPDVTSTLRMPYYGAVLLQWFADDNSSYSAGLKAKATVMAQAIMVHFNQGSGLVNLVNAQTGMAPSPNIWVLGMDYGYAALGLNMIGAITGDQAPSNWALTKLDYIWDNRPVLTNYLYAEAYTPTMWKDPDGVMLCDSDTLYTVRFIYETALLRDNLSQLAHAKDSAYRWYVDSWYNIYWHPARKLDFHTGAAYGAYQIYGDAKKNHMYIYAMLYRLTGDSSYLDRASFYWSNLLNDAPSEYPGLCVGAVKTGSIDYSTPPLLEPEQDAIADGLIDIYESSRVPLFLTYASNLLDRVIDEMPTHPEFLRDHTGRIFFRLAEARHPNGIGRVEMNFGDTGGKVVITGSDNTEVFSGTLPNHSAVVYLPAASYKVEMTLGGDRRSVTANISSGGIVIDYLSGTAATANILCGLVKEDSNDNGVSDTSEGVRTDVEVYNDGNNNGIPETYEPDRNTTADMYTYSGLPSGSFSRIRLKFQSWRRATTPAMVNEVTFHDVGLKVTCAPLASTDKRRISGTVFNDVNHNGVKDVAESGLCYWEVYSDVNNNGIRDSGEKYTRSGPDGRYALADLNSNGTYHIRTTIRAGFTTASAPSGGSRDVEISTPGEEASGKDFGFY